jgi:hypothetical protein
MEKKTRGAQEELFTLVINAKTSKLTKELKSWKYIKSREFRFHSAESCL